MATASPSIARPPASELLDEVIRAPGRWDQMCSMPAPLPFDVPLPLYTLGTRRVFTLSEANIDRLRQQRAEVVAEVVRRLGQIDLAKFKKEVASNLSIKESHQDPHALTGLLLEVVLELNAVETLSGLLRLEGDLNHRLEMVAKDDAASLPELDPDSPVMWQGVPIDPKTHLQQSRLFNARLYQRQLLSVMAALLRHERFPPLLASEMEKRYFELLNRESKSPELSGINKPEDIPPNQRAWIKFDPIYELPVRGTIRNGYIPYTPGLRAQIRQFVMDYQQQLRGSRMLTEPAKGK